MVFAHTLRPVSYRTHTMQMLSRILEGHSNTVAIRSHHIIPLLMVMVVITAVGAAATARAEANVTAQISLEVNIPDHAVIHIRSEERPSAEGPAKFRGDGNATIFDLSCAVAGKVPEQCLELYGGPLLDTLGRPYPPLETDAQGRIIRAGSFPQYFQSPPKVVRIFAPTEGWQLQVELLGLPLLTADRFAAYSDRGGWRCLGYHHDWEGQAACPSDSDASRVPVPITELPGEAGGWHEVTVQLMLRLDGSEPPGIHTGVLRYTLANF